MNSLGDHTLKCQPPAQSGLHRIFYSNYGDLNVLIFNQHLLFIIAVYLGDILYMIHIRSYGAMYAIDTCEAAAKFGHLDCHRYAHENGCPWTIYTCYYAARNGHLDCLRYAILMVVRIGQSSYNAICAIWSTLEGNLI
jgi:hypothetical protein